MTDHKIELALAFLQSQPGSAAAVLEQQPVELTSEFLKEVPCKHAAAVLGKMLPQYAAKLCSTLDPSVAAEFLSALEISMVAAIMRHSDREQRKILELLPERTKIACKLLLNYSEDAVGAWMMTNVITLPDDCTVEEALSRLASADAVINSDVVHVVDRERTLQGLVNVVDLLRASPNSPVTKVMNRERDAISGRTPLISAAKHTVWAHRDTVAVTNRNNKVVGVLRFADLRKGLLDISSTITEPSGSGPLTGLFEVYGSSLLALFDTISEAASENRP